MAEFIVSSQITNANSLPLTPNSQQLDGPQVITEQTAICTAVSAVATSTYRFMSLPSNARLIKLMLRNAAMVGVTAVDFGLAKPVPVGTSPAAAPTYANGTASNQFLFIQGTSLNAVNLAGTDVAFAVTTAANARKRLWELAGFTSDPGGYLDILATVTTGAAVGGAIAVTADYIMP